jgi:hypothetical protein
MYKLNIPSTILFFKFISRLEQNHVITFQAYSGSPLFVEKLEVVSGGNGKGNLYSFSIMDFETKIPTKVSEMIFFVLDKRVLPTDWALLEIFPRSHKSDKDDIDEESMTIEKGVITAFKSKMQKAHRNHANQWLKDLKEQGYLKNK